MTMLVIGIDVGLSGALAAVGPDGFRGLADMPVMLKSTVAKVKNEINPAALAVVLKEWTQGHADEVLIVIERTSSMPGQGVAGMFSMGDSLGCVRGVVGALGFPVEWVSSGSWKRHYGLKAPKCEKKSESVRLAKEQSRAQAINLYPMADLARKADHNKAEALLISRYGWDCLR